ncbi:hypothetical protein R1flu_005789 [Riccia fluitans]|uniref:Uncharacterized protein n=1 Tax=Riccia fluitans TaxID=41844 RepID=A0ABD1YU59_9MARC
MKLGDLMIADARKNGDTIRNVDAIDDPESENEARSESQEDEIPIVIVSNIDQQSDFDTLKQDLLYGGYGIATALAQTKVKNKPEASDPEAGNEWPSYYVDLCEAIPENQRAEEATSKNKEPISETSYGDFCEPT